MPRRINWLKVGLAVLVGWAVVLPAVAATRWTKGGALEAVLATPPGGAGVEALVHGRSLGLTFTCPVDNLAGLDLTVATYQRLNPSRLVLLLYRVEDGVAADPAYRVPLRRAVIGAARLQDWGRARFEFPPVENSRGGRFYAVALSPKTRVFECVGLVLAKLDRASGFQGFKDGKPAAVGPMASVLAGRTSSSWTAGWWWLVAAVTAATGALFWLRGEGSSQRTGPIAGKEER